MIPKRILQFRKHSHILERANVISLPYKTRKYQFQPIIAFSSTPQPNETKKSNYTIENLSPFLTRVGIVSMSVGLLTPAFATLGAAQLWYHYLPKTDYGRYMKHATSFIIGGGGATFIYQYFIPF